jgi:hypothetical protein
VAVPPTSFAAPIAVYSSRLWAILHFQLTPTIFRNKMAADAAGISLIKISFWLTPWVRSDEHLPMSHVAEVTHERGLIWDQISVESSGGLNPLAIQGLPKAAARAFVAEVRLQMNQPVARD